MELKVQLAYLWYCPYRIVNPFNGIERFPLSPRLDPRPRSPGNPFNGIESALRRRGVRRVEDVNPFNGIERLWSYTKIGYPYLYCFESIQWN